MLVFTAKYELGDSTDFQAMMDGMRDFKRVAPHTIRARAGHINCVPISICWLRTATELYTSAMKRWRLRDSPRYAVEPGKTKFFIGQAGF
jgi:hypothetical protein